MKIEIVEAYDNIDDIKLLFSEYKEQLNIDLCFQNYDAEFAGLPGKYAKPDGRLYIAYVNGQAGGCVALRRYDKTRCEMKRLYVRSGFRGMKLGRLLVEKIISDAKNVGYTEILLDTLSTMQTAILLYKSLGFIEIAPYYLNPIEGTHYLSLLL